MSEHADPAILLERLSRLLQNENRAHGLNPVQWEALRYLGRANVFSRNPSALTAYLGITKGTVSQTLAALARHGYLRKSTVGSDRRALRLDLTAAGRRVLAHDPNAVLLAGVTDLPPRQREALTAGLTQLLEGALARRGGQPFGVCAQCRHFEVKAPNGSPHRCGLLDVALKEADSALICVEQVPAA